MGVAVGSQHFEHAISDLQNGHIEGAATQIVNQNLLAAFLVKAISQRRGGRLVDDTQNFQTGDTTGVLGGLTLAVAEIGRHGDDGLRNGFAQIGFRVALQLLQDHGADFLRRVGLAVDGHLVSGTHFTLDGDHGAVGVGDGLTLCDLAHQTFAVLGESNHRRCGARAFGIRDNGRFAAFHHGDAAVGRTKVDTNNLRHNQNPPKTC